MTKHPYIETVRENNAFMHDVWYVRESFDFHQSLTNALGLLNAAIAAGDREEEQLHSLTIWRTYETYY